MKGIEVIPNALSSYAQCALENIVTDNNFPWYYRPTTLSPVDLDPRSDKNQFVHFCYEKSNLSLIHISEPTRPY